MAKVNERFADFIQSTGMSQRDFGNLFDWSEASVSNWCSTTKIKLEHIEKVLLYFPNLNARWLLTGYGIMNNNSELNHSNEIQTPHNHQTHLSECTSPVCVEKIKNLTEMVNELREFKRFLQETVDDLRRKEAATGKRDEGGVESGNERRAAV